MPRLPTIRLRTADFLLQVRVAFAGRGAFFKPPCLPNPAGSRDAHWTRGRPPCSNGALFCSTSGTTRQRSATTRSCQGSNGKRNKQNKSALKNKSSDSPRPYLLQPKNYISEKKQKSKNKGFHRLIYKQHMPRRVRSPEVGFAKPIPHLIVFFSSSFLSFCLLALVPVVCCAL